MIRSNINHPRNKLFIHLLGFASLLHLLLNILLPMTAAAFSPLFGIISYLIILILSQNHMSDRAIQILILISMNLYVLILNFESLSSVTIIYFIIPVMAAALYNNTRPIGLVIFTLIEISILIFGFDGLEKNASTEYNHLSIMVFVLLVLVLTLFHSLYFSRIWAQMENKNRSMEQALLSREGYLHLFFETAKDAMAVFDIDGRVIAINPAFENLYGWSADECIGKIISLVSPESQQEADIRTQKVKQGESFSLLDVVDMKKDGTCFPAQITLSPLFDRTGTVVATSVISRDITYQKQSEKMMVQSEKLKLAGEIAAGVAHEIRNPLTVISGFVQMMQQAPVFPYQQYTKLIQSELERINLIIGEFLVLAKPHAALPKKFSLKNSLHDITELFKPEFNLHGIRFTEYWQEDDYTIEGEEHQLKQVFINIFKNAVEAIDENGTICLGVKKSSNGFVEITLNDNGKGIPPDVLSKIFEPFYTTKSTGTGLGLIISQKIIQGHGGQITILSEEQLGTEAKILLPTL